MSRETIVPLVDADDVAEAAAELFIAAANSAVDRDGRFTVALPGGSTPRKLYALLASAEYVNRVPWEKTHLLFGDERCVPQDHPQSNYRMVREALLDEPPIARAQVHPMAGDMSHPGRAAHFYEAEMRGLFPDVEWPRLDLALLGVGADGHTASLFPGTSAIDERERWAVANYVAWLESWRITMTLPVLCHARMVIFLVTGKLKARVVAEAFGGRPHEEAYPCEQVVPLDGEREILVDRDAAAEL